MKQILSVVALNLRSLPERLGLSMVIVVGIAGVVGVFTALFAMAGGIEKTLVASGRADQALVLRGGSQAELNSTIGRESYELIARSPGVRRDENGAPLASGEIIVIAELPKKGERLGANVTLRGITPEGFALRPNLKMIEGRRFTPGLQELVVGKGAAEQFEGLVVGRSVRLRGADWTVVGIFDSADAFNSEIFTDAATAQTAWGRPNTYSTVLVGLETEDSLATLDAALKADPRLNVEVKRQIDYYSEQTEQTTRGIRVLGSVVAFIMGLGAIFAALNTMYAAVSARVREIATLRAIGFGGFAVVCSVLVEAMLLAAAGGLIGAVLAWIFFNGMTVSTLGGGFTQLVFAFNVSPALILQGVILALVIGFVGGVLPAVRAARMSITTALRAG